MFQNLEFQQQFKTVIFLKNFKAYISKVRYQKFFLLIFSFYFRQPSAVYYFPDNLLTIDSI